MKTKSIYTKDWEDNYAAKMLEGEEKEKKQWQEYWEGPKQK